MIRFLVMLACILALCSCTEEQVRRAEAIAAAADVNVERVNKAVALAEQALATANALAEETHSTAAQHAVESATRALDVAKEGQTIVAEAAQAAHQTVEAAKASQAAGGSTFDVLLTAVGIAVPSLGGLLIALQKMWASGRALAQTVKGIDAAKKTMPEQVWDEHMAPALNAAQDADVRAKVASVQAKAAA